MSVLTNEKYVKEKLHGDFEVFCHLLEKALIVLVYESSSGVSCILLRADSKSTGIFGNQHGKFLQGASKK